MRIGCFIRGSVIIGDGCVVGNSCEYKNSLLLEKVQTPHYNYVGDSVLGNRAHLGAGVICANLRLDKGNVMVTLPEGRVNSNMRKLGAMLADDAEAGLQRSPPTGLYSHEALHRPVLHGVQGIP